MLGEYPFPLGIGVLEDCAVLRRDTLAIIRFLRFRVMFLANLRFGSVLSLGEVRHLNLE